MHEFDAVGVSIRYPAGWSVSESEILISFEDDDRGIDLFFFPSGAQGGFDNNPIAALQDFIWFSGYDQPDKETLHLITVNDSEIAFGSYSSPGESVGLSNPSPLFVAMIFTEEFTISAEFFAPPGNEAENRMLFEMVLASLPPSVFQYAESTPAPTLVPADTLNLPTPPEGFFWQGVQNIEFALPVPEGWFVQFQVLSEMYQSGLQEYDYKYTITRDNPALTGNFFASGMVIYVTKDLESNASEEAQALFADVQNGPYITNVLDSEINQTTSTATYQIHVQSVDPDVSPEDPEYERTVYFVTIADKSANILYIFYFDTPTAIWEDEWPTGQVMVQMLLDLLQK